MTPTQLTGLTMASAGWAKMSPCVNWIMACSLSVGEAEDEGRPPPALYACPALAERHSRRVATAGDARSASRVVRVGGDSGKAAQGRPVPRREGRGTGQGQREGGARLEGDARAVVRVGRGGRGSCRGNAVRRLGGAAAGAGRLVEELDAPAGDQQDLGREPVRVLAVLAPAPGLQLARDVDQAALLRVTSITDRQSQGNCARRGIPSGPSSPAGRAVTSTGR